MKEIRRVEAVDEKKFRVPVVSILFFLPK